MVRVIRVIMIPSATLVGIVWCGRDVLGCEHAPDGGVTHVAPENEST
jgi:hypothetical protein